MITGSSLGHHQALCLDTSTPRLQRFGKRKVQPRRARRNSRSIQIREQLGAGYRFRGPRSARINDKVRRLPSIGGIHAQLIKAVPAIIAFATELLTDPKARRTERRWAASVLLALLPRRARSDAEEPAQW